MNIKRHLSEALTGIGRHFAMSLSAISAVTVTLTLMSILLLLIINISQITINLQESVSIFVKVDNEIAEESIPALKSQIEKIEGVSSVEYSSKEDELQKLKEEFGEDGSMFDIYSGENNPLSRAFIVEIAREYKLADISSKIGKIQGVKEAMFGGSTTEQFIDTLSTIRMSGGIIIISLSLLAIFLVSNTIKITIYARQEETAIMRFVGATNGFIRAPFVIEGILVGLFGSIVPVILTIFGYNLLFESLEGKLITGMLTLKPVFPFVFQVSGVLIGMGIIVGFIGSLFAVNKNLRWKR